MRTRKKIRLHISSRYPVFFEGLANGLKPYKEIDIIGISRNIAELKSALAAGGFDVLLTDLSFRGREMRLVKSIKETTVKIAVYASRENADLAYSALIAGANGYISKSSGMRQIAKSLRAIADGKKAETDPQLEALFWQQMGGDRARPHQKTRESKLIEAFDFTPREQAVVSLLIRGLTNEDISLRLAVSSRTVRRYNTAIYRKLGVRNRREAINRILTRT